MAITSFMQVQIYKSLYNSVDETEELVKLSEDLETKITSASLDDVDKVTDEIVHDAATKLKVNKIDPIFEFTSNTLKNAPNLLFVHLSVIIKSYLIHAHVSTVLLLSTLVPIIKDKMGDICSSQNYRSIAISSLILKILDWIIILLFGTSLGLDDLQFSYQENCSTTMCSYLVIETISYFLRKGSEVFTCMMDMSKAFDMVKYSVLFKKLLYQGLSVIFIRLLLAMYVQQYVNVRWNGQHSSQFPLSNGVKQGAVLSAILYCVHMNGLYEELRRKRSGCWIGQDYLGILGYADDTFLLAPTQDSLQDMIKTCEQYAAEHNLKFSTNPDINKCKTKCMAYLHKQRDLRKLELCGDKLPWTPNGKHLGNTMENEMNGMVKDLLCKRARFIQKNNELVQEFHFAHPRTLFELNLIYNSHFTGSPLWDLFGKESEMLEKTWNKSFRIMYNLPIETHRYFVEAISGSPHIKNILIQRFLKKLKENCS